MDIMNDKYLSLYFFEKKLKQSKRESVSYICKAFENDVCLISILSPTQEYICDCEGDLRKILSVF